MAQIGRLVRRQIDDEVLAKEVAGVHCSCGAVGDGWLSVKKEVGSCREV